ncbi:MAG: type IX secretion system membrane protein PorP/SprF [Flavobacteriaceae bacterium]|jgi:type IX secretion system PorP/SprF family membrane protein
MRRLLSYVLLNMSLLSWAQTETVINQSKFFQIDNPSYFGFNRSNKIGVLYSKTKISETSQVNHQYIFGSITLEDQPFSLGLDLNNYTIQNSNFKVTFPRIAFVYQLQVDTNIYILPGISFGYWNETFNKEGLVFEDQINRNNGYINPETDDPMGNELGSSDYVDVGASFLLHTDRFFLGVSLTKINQPEITLSSETPVKSNINLSAQGGVEWNINRHQRNFLPEQSYLFIFNNIRYIDKVYSFNLSQELQLNEFSVGLSQRASNSSKFSLNGMGVNFGLTLENFNFGMQYYFPINKGTTNFASNVFELYLIFEFTPFRRNNLRSYKRLQVDNY